MVATAKRRKVASTRRATNLPEAATPTKAEAEATGGDPSPSAAGGVSLKRVRGAESAVDQAVSRAIKDHFGCYQLADMMEATVAGESLFSYVRRHWVASRSANKNLTAAWWAQLHENVHGVRDWVDLEPRPGSPDPDSLFCAALEECHSKNPAQRRCHKMDQYLRSCEKDLEHIEVCALFNSIAKSFRRQCKFATDYGLTVARYVAKRRLQSVYEEEVRRMHRFFDKSITELFCRLKKSEINHTSFIASHRSLVDLVIDSADLDIVLAGEKRATWTQMRSQVQRVVNGSALGRSLYADTWSKVQGVEFSEKVSSVLKQVEQMTRSDLDLKLDSIRSELARLAQEVAKDKAFRAAPMIELEFLGARLRLPSGDPAKEVNFRLEAMLRSKSIGYQGGVIALAHETWLWPERHTLPAVVRKEHLLECDVARQHFITVARRSANTMLCQYISMVEDRKAKQFLDLDPFFLLEVLFLRHHTEVACNLAVQTRLMKCLPDSFRRRTVQESLNELTALRATPLVKDGELGESTQLLDAVEEQINLLTNSVGPTLGDDASTMKKTLFEHYAWFFSWSDSPAGSSGPRRGKDAFVACCDNLRARFAVDPKSIRLPDLQPLSGFKFLMGSDLEAEYRLWMSSAAKNFDVHEEVEDGLPALVDGLDDQDQGGPDIFGSDVGVDGLAPPPSGDEAAPAVLPKDAPLAPLLGAGESVTAASELPGSQAQDAARPARRGGLLGAVAKKATAGKSAAKAAARIGNSAKPASSIADLFGKKYA